MPSGNKLSDQRRCDDGDIMFLIRHVTSHTIYLQGYMNLGKEAPGGDFRPCYV